MRGADAGFALIFLSSPFFSKDEGKGLKIDQKDS